MVIIGGHSSLLDRCKMAEAPPAALAKLAVLATARVDPRLPAPRVAPRLAGDAGAAPGQGLALRLRIPLAAILAIIGAFALGEAEARQFDGVGHRDVELFVHGAVARPAIGHRSASPPGSSRASAGSIGSGFFPYPGIDYTVPTLRLPTPDPTRPRPPPRARDGHRR